MSNRSSIFSFDMFPEKIYPNKAFVLMLLFVSISFGGMFAFLHSERGKRALEPRLGKLAFCLENNLRHSDKPLILFIGTSRFHSGISEETFAKRNPNYCFLNLSAHSLQEWECQWLLDKIPSNTDKIGGVVLETHFSQFSENGMHAVTHEKPLFPRGYDIFSSFSERLHYRNPKARKILLLHWFYIRLPLKNYLLAAKTFCTGQNIQRIPPPSHRFNENFALQLKNSFDYAAPNIARYHLNEYFFSERRKKLFENTITTLQDKKIPFVFVHVPVRQEYIDYFLTASEKEKQQFNAVMSYYRSIGQTCPLLFWKTPEDLGLTNDIFLDYGHFSRNGSVVFSNYLWNVIETNHLFDLQPQKEPTNNETGRK